MKKLALLFLASSSLFAQYSFPPAGGSGGGGATPTGPSGAVQFNNAGALGGDSNLAFDPTFSSLVNRVPDVTSTAVSNTSGGGTYNEYFVIAKFSNGTSTGFPMSWRDIAYVSDGPVALDSTHYVDISWPSVPNVTGYDVCTDYREGTQAAVGKIGSVDPATLAFRDDGVAGDGTDCTLILNTTGDRITGLLTTTSLLATNTVRVSRGLTASSVTTDNCTACDGVLLNPGQFSIFIGNAVTQTSQAYLPFSNIAIGKSTLEQAVDTNGILDGGENIAIGASALAANTIGHDNLAIGTDTLFSLLDGTYNVVVGERAMQDLQHGDANAVLGEEAGGALNGGSDHNVFVGAESWHTQTTGNSNTVLGTYAGFNASGNLNVFLGYKAGYNETGSNKLYIANSETATPLIAGDFSAATLFINGRAGATLHTPASSSEACTAGQFSDDASFHYVCVSAGVWKRVALSSF